MVLRGQISNGVVQIDGQVTLPDGTRVLVFLEDPAVKQSVGRVQLPLVPSAEPGSVNLDSQRIAELLDDNASP